MTVVVRKLGEKHMDAYLKGAPEVVASLCKQHTGQALILHAQGWMGTSHIIHKVFRYKIKLYLSVFNYCLYISVSLPACETESSLM